MNEQPAAAPSADNKNEPYGYLLVHFKEDPNGYAERIYMDLSDGDNPHRWNPLNNGEPILTSTLGTTGVRDPHIIRNPRTGTWYIIATDLRVFGGETGSEQGYGWYDWSHHGSTNLIIWESQDLVHFSDPRELDVSVRKDGTHLELGMAWACECLWVDDFYEEGHQGGRGAFVMYWSSKVFADGDTEHSNESVCDTVLWGSTTDFTQDSYEYGGVFIDTGGNSIDTTMVQRKLEDGVIRTYRITKDNSFGHGIWMDSTDAQRWWEPKTPWKRIQENIGDEYQVGNGVEGPAVFPSHSCSADGKAQWYLFVDVIPSIGYKPMITTDLDSGWRPLEDPDFFLSPHTKHGGVASLTREEYERLDSLSLYVTGWKG
jgi:hypothetical protein